MLVVGTPVRIETLSKKDVSSPVVVKPWKMRLCKPAPNIAARVQAVAEPGIVLVTSSCPAAADPDDPTIHPTHHIFVGSKAAWEIIADDLPQYEGHVG